MEVIVHVRPHPNSNKLHLVVLAYGEGGPLPAYNTWVDSDLVNLDTEIHVLAMHYMAYAMKHYGLPPREVFPLVIKIERH